jgi:hypothetical protein
VKLLEGEQMTELEKMHQSDADSPVPVPELYHRVIRTGFSFLSFRKALHSQTKEITEALEPLLVHRNKIN